MLGFVISMMAFRRNIGISLFAIISGLVFEIGDTNAEVPSVLSSAGISVSTSTVELLKKIPSTNEKQMSNQLDKRANSAVYHI